MKSFNMGGVLLPSWGAGRSPSQVQILSLSISGDWQISFWFVFVSIVGTAGGRFSPVFLGSGPSGFWPPHPGEVERLKYSCMKISATFVLLSEGIGGRGGWV